jgi:hypothetical protein
MVADRPRPPAGQTAARLFGYTALTLEKANAKLNRSS